MGEKAIKGKAITKVLSCLVVFAILMSVFSVAVIATDSASSTASNVTLNLNDEVNSSVESMRIMPSGNSDLSDASNTSSPDIINESDEVPDPDLPVINDTDIDTAKTVSAMSSCSYVWIEITDKYCKGYKVYVDGKYKLKEDGDGYCCFKVTPGYHTFKLTLNGKEVSKGWNCQCGHVYNWMSMNEMDPHWCEDGNDNNNQHEVKFRGEVTYDSNTLGAGTYIVTVDEVLYDPQDYFKWSGDAEVNWGIWNDGPYVENADVGDKVEVFGRYTKYDDGIHVVDLETSSHYLKKIDSGSLSIDVWTADASKNTKTEFEPGGNIYIWVKTNRPVTIDLIVDIYYDSGGHVQKYLRDDKRLSAANEYYNVWTAGEPGRRVLTLKAWDDYGNYAEDEWTFHVKGDQGDCSSVVNFKGTATADENKGIGYYGSYYCKVKVEELLSNPGNRLKVGNEYIVCYGNSPKSIKTGDKVEVYGEYYHTCGPLQWVGQIIAFDNDYYVKKREEKKTGSLTVTIYPSEVRSGAWWKLTSGPDTNWHSSGYTIINIPLDYYTMRFSDVTGWTKPSDKTVTITEGSNYESGWYTKEKENQSPTAHIVSIRPNPTNQGETVSFSGYGTDPDGDLITAYNWRSSIDGQLSTSPSFSTSSLSVGAHTIYFKVKDSHNAWSDEILMSLDISSEIRFIGTLIEQNWFMGFLSYYFEVDEAPEGSVPVGDKIRVYVYTDGYPNQGTYDQLESGDRAEVYAEFEKWRGKEFDQWVDYKVWVADIRDNEKYYVEKMEEKPDLIVQDISWSPENPKEGDNVTFCVQVKNQGLGNAKKESLLTINDSFVNSMIHSYVVHTFIIPPLCAGKTITKTDPWKDKLSLCGTHTVRAIADIDNVIDESNEYNNERTETLNVPCEKPDLIIQDILWKPENPKQGDNVEFTITVKNQGKGNAGKFLVAGEMGKGYDKLLKSFEFTVPSLAVGKVYTYMDSWKADECGDIIMFAKADVWNAIDEGSDEGNNDRTETINIVCDTKEWSFMVYMDADNDIEWMAVSSSPKGDFLEMSEIGSTEDVNVVVQLDRHGGKDWCYDFGDWTTCKRFKITKNLKPDSEADFNEEVNMGHPNTLYDFITWVKKEYSAQHYCLVLWDHGSGWEGCCKDNTSNDDKLTLQEIKQAFKQAGMKFDVIVFDACIMGNIETVYQLNDYTNTVIASEDIGGHRMSPYDATLQELTKKPNMSWDELGRIWVDEYYKFYKLNYPKYDFSVSKIDTKHIVQLKDSVDTLAKKLIQYWPSYRKEISAARNNAEKYAKSTNHEDEYVDIYDFSQLIKESDVPSDLKNAADNVIDLINHCVYSKTRSTHPNSKGLSIYFPLKGSTKYKGEYDQLDFAKDTKWDDWLKIYLREEKEPDLTVQDIWWSPSNPKEGDTVTFTVKVKNQGSGSAGTSTVKYYIDGSYVGSDTVPSLSAGSTSTQTFMWKANKCGDVQVKAIADATNAVAENNEGNNERTETVSVICLFYIRPACQDVNGNHLDGVSYEFVDYPSYKGTCDHNEYLIAPGFGTYKVKFTKGYLEATVTLESHLKAFAGTVVTLREKEKKPDLIIQDISWIPPNPKQGDNVEFTIIVKNIGKGTADKSHVFIQTINWDAGKRLFKINDLCPSLKPGEVYTFHKNVKIEDCGEYDLMAWADAQNEVNETNEINNYKDASFTVPCPKEKPDLTVESITLSPSSPAAQEGTITFTVKIENKGAGDAGGFYVYYYIDGSNVDSDHISSLSAGATTTQTFKWTANKCGNVKVKAIADADKAVDESNEDNNERTGTIHIRCPDLKVESVTYSPEKVHQGTMITVTAKIKNIGDADARESNTNIEFTDSAGQRKGGEVAKMGALSVGEKTTIEKNYLMQQAGKRILSVEANYDKKVKESNYENNKKEVTIEVTKIPISVTVYNVNKKKLGWNGKINVKAYGENNERVANAEKSFNNVDSVTVSLQVPSDASLIRVFQTPNIKDGVKEYWGSVYIQPTGQTTYEFTRHTSWISDDITINGHSIYSDTINLNKKGNYDIAIPVTNSGYSESSVIVEVLLDRDEKAPWDFRTDDLISINSKKEKDFHFTYKKDKETTGVWRFRAIVKEQYESEGGAIAYTDQHAWYLILGEKPIGREISLGVLCTYYSGVIGQEPEDVFNEGMRKAWAVYGEEIGEITTDAILYYDPILGALVKTSQDPFRKGIDALINFANSARNAWNDEWVADAIKKCFVGQRLKNFGDTTHIKTRVECWKSRDVEEIGKQLINEGKLFAYFEGFSGEALNSRFVSGKTKEKMEEFHEFAKKEYDYTGQMYYDLKGYGKFDRNKAAFNDLAMGEQGYGKQCAKNHLR